MTGRFIVLDGIDGCGKSTQIRHLAQWLPSSGLMPPTAQLICTREPGGTRVGQSIRELLLDTDAHQVSRKADMPSLASIAIILIVIILLVYA